MVKNRKKQQPHKKGKKTQCYSFHLSDGGRLESCASSLDVAKRKSKQWERGRFNIDKVKVYAYGYKPKRK